MNPYFQRQILEAEPVDLVRLLHQHAIASIKEAKTQLAAGNIAARVKAISTAYVVTAELLKSMKAEAAPEIARQLHDLYCFVQQCLNEANAKKAEKPLNDALGILTTLLEGWNGIAAAAAPREEQAASGIHAVARGEGAARLMVSA